MTEFKKSLSVGAITASLSRKAGGVIEPIISTARGLQKADVSVSVYGLTDASFESDKVIWGDTPAQVFSAPSPLGFLAPSAMDRAVGAGDHDLLHLHGLWLSPSVVAARWTRKFSRPLLISPHGMLDKWALRQSFLKKSIALATYEGRNLRSAACLHALNKSEAASIRAAGLQNPIATIPNGIALSPGQTSYHPPAFLKSDRRKVLLFLGRIHRKKGLVEVVEAWAEVVRHSPAIAREWAVVLAGWDDGGHADAVASSIRQRNLSAHVYLPGPVFGAEKRNLLGYARAFILASHSEGLPMSVLEAWACKLPVFMTAECNLTDSFRIRAAIEISHEPVGIAKCLIEHLSRDELQAFGMRAHAFVKDRYTVEKISDAFRDLYRWLSGMASRPETVSLE